MGSNFEIGYIIEKGDEHSYAEAADWCNNIKHAQATIKKLDTGDFQIISVEEPVLAEQLSSEIFLLQKEIIEQEAGLLRPLSKIIVNEGSEEDEARRAEIVATIDNLRLRKQAKEAELLALNS